MAAERTPVRSRTGASAPRRHGLACLSKGLAALTDAELEAALATARIRRSELFMAFNGNAPHRRLMGRMMKAFGVDRAEASRHRWRELLCAESRCAGCCNAARCRRWFEGRAMRTTPKDFCPNAELFEHMRATQHAAAQAKSRVYDYGPDGSHPAAVQVEAAWKAVRALEEKGFRQP